MNLEITTAFVGILAAVYESSRLDTFDRDVVLWSVMTWGWYCVGCDDSVYTACARLRNDGRSLRSESHRHYCNTFVDAAASTDRCGVACECSGPDIIGVGV